MNPRVLSKIAVHQFYGIDSNRRPLARSSPRTHKHLRVSKCVCLGGRRFLKTRASASKTNDLSPAMCLGR
jgi:hypothetical protein